MAVASGDRIKPRPRLAPQRVGRLPPLPLRPDDRPTQILGYPEAGYPVPQSHGLRSLPLHRDMANHRCTDRADFRAKTGTAAVSAFRWGRASPR